MNKLGSFPISCFSRSVNSRNSHLKYRSIFISSITWHQMNKTDPLLYITQTCQLFNWRCIKALKLLHMTHLHKRDTRAKKLKQRIRHRGVGLTQFVTFRSCMWFGTKHYLCLGTSRSQYKSGSETNL